MVSEYEYITIEDLEAFMIMDLETTNPKLTDVKVYEIISDAERVVNKEGGQCDDGWDTPPAYVKTATKMVASTMIHNQLVRDHTIEEEYRNIYSDDFILLMQQDDKDWVCTGFSK